MAKSSNYNIVVGVEFTPQQIQQQLDAVARKLNPIKVKAEINNISGATASVEKLKTAVDKTNKSAGDLNTTFNVANQIFHDSIKIIGSMVNQVFELDSALTEFKKVSDLSGSALDNYVDKLTSLGQTVARTGKPNRYEPVCWDGKPA